MHPKDFGQKFPGTLHRIRDDGLTAFVPSPLLRQLEIGPGIAKKHETAVLALGALGAVTPTLPFPGLVTSPFLTREAVLSSRIEGTQTEVDQLYLFEVDEESADSQASPEKETNERADAIEVRNYIQALRYGLGQIATRPVHARLLREMHEILLTGVRGEQKSPGQYRWKQAFLGAKSIEHARYVAPPPDQVDQLMNALELYINDPDSDQPSLIRIACIHYQFEAIHPFTDGNGRLGRLLVSLLLSTYGLLSEPFLYLSAYFERHKADYADYLWQVSRHGAWDDWLSFFLDGVIQEAKDAADRARKLLSLREGMRAKLQRSRSSAKALELADRLFVNPAVSIKQAERFLQMSYGGASKVVHKLEKVGLLQEATSRQRNRVFISTPIIDLLR